MVQAFPQTLSNSLTLGDWTVTDHQVLTSITAWATIATYQVPAQTKIRVGQGDVNHPDNQGHVYLFLRSGETTPAEITGKWRIIITDYNETKKVVVKEFEGIITHGSRTDIKLMIPLPEFPVYAGEDSYIMIQFKPVAVHSTAGAGNDNIGWGDVTESLIDIPVTVYI